MSVITDLGSWGNNTYTLAHSVKDPEKAANLRAASAIFWMMAGRLAVRPPWLADEAQVAHLLETAYKLADDSGLEFLNAEAVAGQIADHLRTP